MSGISRGTDEGAGTRSGRDRTFLYRNNGANGRDTNRMRERSSSNEFYEAESSSQRLRGLSYGREIVRLHQQIRRNDPPEVSLAPHPPPIGIWAYDQSYRWNFPGERPPNPQPTQNEPWLWPHRKHIECYRCHLNGHIADDCPYQADVCFHCFVVGHTRPECPLDQPRRHQSFCRACRVFGHRARDCPDERPLCQSCDRKGKHAIDCPEKETNWEVPAPPSRQIAGDQHGISSLHRPIANVFVGGGISHRINTAALRARYGWTLETNQRETRGSVATMGEASSSGRNAAELHGAGAAQSNGADVEESHSARAAQSSRPGMGESSGTGAEESSGTGAEESSGTGAEESSAADARELSVVGERESMGMGAEWLRGQNESRDIDAEESRGIDAEESRGMEGAATDAASAIDTDVEIGEEALNLDAMDVIVITDDRVPQNAENNVMGNDEPAPAREQPQVTPLQTLRSWMAEQEDSDFHRSPSSSMEAFSISDDEDEAPDPIITPDSPPPRYQSFGYSGWRLHSEEWLHGESASVGRDAQLTRGTPETERQAEESGSVEHDRPPPVVPALPVNLPLRVIAQAAMGPTMNTLSDEDIATRAHVAQLLEELEDDEIERASLAPGTTCLLCEERLRRIIFCWCGHKYACKICTKKYLAEGRYVCPWCTMPIKGVVVERDTDNYEHDRSYELNKYYAR